MRSPGGGRYSTRRAGASFPVRRRSRRRERGLAAARSASTPACVRGPRRAAKRRSPPASGTWGSFPRRRRTRRGRTEPAPVWMVHPARRPPRRAFVDFQNDTTAADLDLAVREGFESIEHVKRYTLLGFGTDQGKLGNVTGMAVVAAPSGGRRRSSAPRRSGRPIPPVTFGAAAGLATGEHHDPLRVTPMHEWHEAEGAVFEPVGQWLRPWYYPRPGGGHARGGGPRMPSPHEKGPRSSMPPPSARSTSRGRMPGSFSTASTPTTGPTSPSDGAVTGSCSGKTAW